MRISDWSSDVCSSDLPDQLAATRLRRALMWNMIGTASAFLLGIIAIAGAFAMGSDWLGNSRANDLPRLSAELGLKLYQTYSMRPGIFGTAVIADSSVINNNLAPSDFMARTEEHTSELQSLMRISYAVFCLTQKKTIKQKA